MEVRNERRCDRFGRAERGRQGQEGRRTGERARGGPLGASDEERRSSESASIRSSIDDVYWGCAMPEATQGLNVARLAWLRAGLPVDVPSATINRFCSSGLQTVALAAQEIMSGMADVVLAGGVEMMSQVPMSGYHTRLDPEITESYIGMGFTAERVAARWKVTREDQDRWALGSQQKAARALSAGAFDEQIVPCRWSARHGRARRRCRDVGVRARRAAANRHEYRGARQVAPGVQGQGHGHRRELESVL